MSTTDKTPDSKEIRDVIEGVELRGAPEGSKSPGTMVGYAAKYERYSEDLGYFREKIAPGAFDKALKTCDVRALFNHDPNFLLGRMSAGTLRCTTDEVGLRVEIDLPDTNVGRDVAESIRRRDLAGQSFSFTASIVQWDFSGDVAVRTLIELDQLFDIGPVTFPAYTDTSVAMRDFQTEKESRSLTDSAAIAAAQAATLAVAAASAAATQRDHDTARLRLTEVS